MLTLVIGVTAMAYGVCAAFDGFDFKERPRLAKFEVDNLNGFHLFGDKDQLDMIFEPLFHDEIRKHSRHNIEIVDKFGKFMKLYYDARHHDNAEVLKLDNRVHKSKLTSLICLHDEVKTIELGFKSQDDAARYLVQIQQTVNDNTKNYFLTAGHDWRCTQSNGRYESVMRKVTYAYVDEIDDSKLVLHTEEAGLVDIFAYLDLDFSTNVGMLQHKHFPATDDQRTVARNGRHLQNWLEDAFTWVGSKVVDYGTEIVDGIKQVYNKVKAIVETVAEGIETVAKLALGVPVDFDGTFTVASWSFNYDKVKQANKTFKIYGAKDESGIQVDLTLEASTNCTNCYAQADVVITYQLKIASYSIRRIYCVLKGTAEVNAEIEGKAGVTLAIQIPIGEYPLPDLAISVGDVKLGIYIGGSVEIGAKVELEVFKFGFHANGSIEEGFEHDKDQNIDRWINTQDFGYERKPGKLIFGSAQVAVYVTPLIFLTLEKVGKVWCSLEIKAQADLDRNNADCGGVYVTPKIILSPTVGINITLIKWGKEWPIAPYQSTLSEWAGCIPLSKATQIQVPHPTGLRAVAAKHQIPDDDDDDAAFLPELDEIDNGGRRRMAHTPTHLSGNNTETFIDLEQVVESEMFALPGFGVAGDRWWGNLTTIPHLCSDRCPGIVGALFPVLIAHDSTLLVQPLQDSSSSLVAVFRTHFTLENDTASEWSHNIEVLTNLSCTTRHHLMLDASDVDDVPTYDVTLLEWHCDTNMSVLGLNEYANDSSADSLAFLCMISLPSQVNALHLDSSFGNIMLFDEQWCTVFSLVQRPSYEITVEQINTIDWDTVQYPTKLWHGTWSCGEETSSDMELYFADYDHEANSVVAWLVSHDAEFNDTAGELEISTWYVEGNVSLEHKNMSLQLLDLWIGDETESVANWSIEMHGALAFLMDGAITYSGSITVDGYSLDCTGFVFQGHVNMSQFDKASDDAESDDAESDDNAENLYCVAYDDYYIWSVTGGVLVALLCAFDVILCICCWKYRQQVKNATVVPADAASNIEIHGDKYENLLEDSTHNYLLRVDASCDLKLLAYLVIVAQAACYGVLLNAVWGDAGKHNVPVQVDHRYCNGELELVKEMVYPNVTMSLSNLSCEVNDANLDPSLVLAIIAGLLIVMGFVAPDVFVGLRLFKHNKFLSILLLAEGAVASLVATFLIFETAEQGAVDIMAAGVGVIFVHDLDEKLKSAVDQLAQSTQSWKCCSCDHCQPSHLFLLLVYFVVAFIITVAVGFTTYCSANDWQC